MKLMGVSEYYVVELCPKYANWRRNFKEMGI